MSGWIKLHRGILKHWVATEPELLAVFARLLLEANFEDKKSLINGTLMDVKRGQLIYGRKAFSTRSGVSETKLRRYIKLLESDQVINQQKFPKFTLISIVNYDQYQVIDQQTTSKSPSIDHQVTTPKEVKNLRSKEITPNTSATADCPHSKIVELYHEHCPTMPRIKIWSDKRKRILKSRWAEDKKRQKLDWWKGYFEYVNESSFLRGADGKWQADLEWLINPSNMVKVIEGKYEDRGEA